MLFTHEDMVWMGCNNPYVLHATSPLEGINMAIDLFELNCVLRTTSPLFYYLHNMTHRNGFHAWLMQHWNET